MKDIKVTVASLRSILVDPRANLRRVDKACRVAQRAGARLIVLPELMLTGHGGHPKMTEHAEPVPDGPLSKAIVEMSAKYSLCICVGLAELSNRIVYNSQMVADKGKYLGLQRKINLSGDEYCHFGAGESVEAFDIGDIRFGICICYDNLFPELALIHSLNHVDLILAPHAARMGTWPARLTRKFCAGVIQRQQADWEKVHRARAYDHNVYVLLCNAAGPSTKGLKDVVANHAGTVMGVDPYGDTFLRTRKRDFSDELVTVELKSAVRKQNHGPTRNRRMPTVLKLMSKCLAGMLITTAAMATAGDRYVSRDGGHRPPFANWSDAATNIQAAVDAGPAGATVWIRKGVYRGAGDPVVSISRALTLRSESGNPADVVVDGQGARRGIRVALAQPDAAVTIAGITVTNGYTSAALGHGAGIDLDHQAVAAGTAEVRRCVIAGNVNASPNGHNHGGGLASRGQSGSAFHTVVTDCLFLGNATRNANSRGGGAAFADTRLTLDNCRIENNRAETEDASQSSYGGGVYIMNVPTGSVIRQCRFRGNAAAGGGGGTTGGGLTIWGDNTDLVLEHCSFDRNLAPYGSDLMQGSGQVTLRNCRFAKRPSGRALWLGWGAQSRSTTLIFDCTIAGGIHMASEHASLKARDSLKDPAVDMDETGAIKPIRTLEEWNKRQALTISRIEQVAGPLPDKSFFPTPDLNVLKDEAIEGGLRRQLIEYNAESKAAPRIRAWLFSPTTNSCLEPLPPGTARRPAVLCPHQTNRKTGKREPAGLEGDPNMFYALELARRGFVTLAPDFTGSGEHPGLSTYSNSFVSATMKGISDHIRAVDLLCSLPGVDPERIGCCGHSLGGFNTMMVSVFEPRIRAVVSSCGYVNWQAYADREGSLSMMAGGNYMPLINRDYACHPDMVPFDWHEVVAALAPRPLFVNAPLRDDPFLVEGVCETIDAARPIYALYGATNAIETTHPDCGHGFPPEVREKAYAFLERQLGK